jgi:hypothetical protein
MEDNYIKLIGTQARGITDTQGAGRYVLRYNHIINGSAGDHGTEGAPTRGGRAVEEYNNTIDFEFNTTTAVQGTRSGNKLAHDNTVTKAGVTNFHGAGKFRAFGSAGGTGAGNWRNADGSGPWDKCVTDVDPGGEFPGLDKNKQHWVDTASNAPHPPYLFYSGVVSQDDPANSNSTGTLTVAGAPWKPGAWESYSVTNMDFAWNYVDGATTAGSTTLASAGANFYDSRYRA